MADSSRMVGLTSQIVSAFVRRNSVPTSAMPELIADVYRSLGEASGSIAADPPPAVPLVPAVPVKKSVTDDFIICLEDGKKYKSLRRHLQTAYGMTPEQYRAKWDLPPSYPMVASAYSAARSSLAKATGLGASRKKLVEISGERPQSTPKKAVGRPRKKAA